MSATQAKPSTIDFWNGNRSEVRQNHEKHILEAVLEATSKQFGDFEILENRDDYPGEEESLAFTQKNHDLLVTIAGNQKFNVEDVILIPQPLAKNILGYRVCIINKKDHDKFKEAKTSKIKKLIQGIPRTWSDADIFRSNGYEVKEEGHFDDIFQRLSANRFDYITFGINEVESIYNQKVISSDELIIEDKLLFFYPFPLVFYVNPKQKSLANRIEKGLQIITANGTLDNIFKIHYGNLTRGLNLKNRHLFSLKNPLTPKKFNELKPDLNLI
jgi:hypothetical protein